MKSLRILIAAALLASLSSACSSDDKKASSGAALDACNAYCDKVGNHCGDAGASTDVDYTSATDCKSSQCSPAIASEPAACQTSAAAYFNCLSAQTDICTQGCMTELLKMAADCPQ